MKPLITITLIYFLAWCSTSHANNSLQQQRTLYQQIVLELESGNDSNYLGAKHLLKHYPLLPYLEYNFIKQQFDQLPSKKVKQFTKQYSDSYIAAKLSSQWLNYLGVQKQWSLFEQFYDANKANHAQQCFHLESKLAQADQNDKQQTALLAQISLLWLKPYSLPKACDTVFDFWREKQQLNADLAWQRFQLSYAENNQALAKYLIRYLDDERKQLANQILQADKYAELWLTRLQDNTIKLDSAVITKLIRHISRVGHHEQLAAILRNQVTWLSTDDLIETRQVIAWHLARESTSDANQWLGSINSSKGLENHQLRYAVQEKNWLLYQKVFTQTNETIQNNDEWLYWYAIAQTESGLHDENPAFQSKTIMQRLASRRSFYGFLAAEKQQQAITLANAPIAIESKIDPALQRKLAIALELYQVGDLIAANSEWHYATKTFNEEQWQQAGLIAHQAQWHDKTIQAFAQAKQWDALDARFPLAWQELFYKHSRLNAIEQSWLLAMARQESGFSPRAQSAVGAIGVLQLMPATAKQLAKQNTMDYQYQLLFDADYNITLGTQYLKSLLNRFDNNYILATAAYNAGPHRVEQWLAKQPITDDWEHWVATIPFPETRNYVQNILTYSLIYQTRLGTNDIQLGFNKL